MRERENPASILLLSSFFWEEDKKCLKTFGREKERYSLCEQKRCVQHDLYEANQRQAIYGPVHV